jgi:hypothetical protein
VLGGTYGKHLVSLVKNKHLHSIRLEEATLDHVVDTTRGTNDDLGAVLQSLHVITNARAANAGVALDVHEVANSDNDLLDLLGQLTGGREDQSLALLDVLVDLLQDRNGEGGGLACTRLGLSNDIVALSRKLATPETQDIRSVLTLDHGHDSTLLNGRRALETIGVDTFRKILARVLAPPQIC